MVIDTDFQKMFDLILQVFVNGNLKEDQMIKIVFVFCDMGERVWVCGTGDCVLKLELRLAVALPAWILSP